MIETSFVYLGDVVEGVDARPNQWTRSVIQDNDGGDLLTDVERLMKEKYATLEKAVPLEAKLVNEKHTRIMSLQKTSEGVEEATTEKEKAQRNVLRLQDQLSVESVFHCRTINPWPSCKKRQKRLKPNQKTN
jgi:hypothetical protein